jgi:hypothetical protein
VGGAGPLFPSEELLADMVYTAAMQTTPGKRRSEGHSCGASSRPPGLAQQPAAPDTHP